MKIWWKRSLWDMIWGIRLFGHAGERALDQVHPGLALHTIVRERPGCGSTGEERKRAEPYLGSPQWDHESPHQRKSFSHWKDRWYVFSDKIAYIHHDMDDAQRAGIITEDDIPVTMRTFLGYTTRERLNTFVHNIIENSMGKDSISMSPDVFEAMMELRALMFRNVYENPVARKEEDKVIQMLSELYGYYTDHPEAMSREYRELVEYRGVPKEQAVCDYISGMTDQYSMEKFREIYIPRAWEVY